MRACFECRANYRGNSTFDVILAGTCIYVMDILFFNNVDYGESEAESRLFTLLSRVRFPWPSHSQLSETEYWVHCDGKQYAVAVIVVSCHHHQVPPFYNCTEKNLLSAYNTVFPFQLNGFLFLQYARRGG